MAFFLDWEQNKIKRFQKKFLFLVAGPIKKNNFFAASCSIRCVGYQIVINMNIIFFSITDPPPSIRS